jgi:chromosome partitioning protein
MKTLTVANQKGGVGKTAVLVQYVYFLSLLAKKRVLIVDLDHQCNTSKALALGKLATVSTITSSALLKSKTSGIDHADFVLVGGDKNLIRMERHAAEHNAYATHLHHFLSSVADQYDFCLIDTNPNPDIRQLAALVVSDFVLSPIQLNQEAIDGIGDLLHHENIGIRKIQATVNKKLCLIGILPNIVEPTPFQRDNFRDLANSFAKLLIPLNAGYAAIKKTTAIPEAQAIGAPVWKLGKTSGREAWTQMRPVFEKITHVMESSNA